MFCFYIYLDITCESSAWQTSHLKCQCIVCENEEKVSSVVVIGCSAVVGTSTLRLIENHYLSVEDFDRRMRSRIESARGTCVWNYIMRPTIMVRYVQFKEH